MKEIILFIILVIGYFTHAQNQTRDIIHLKNGSIIKGTITEMNPSVNLKIKTTDGSLFVYSMSEILKMEKEEFVGNEVNQKTTSLVSQSALENVFKNYIEKNRPKLKYIGVSKENGIRKEINGQEVYVIEYELIIESLADIYINNKPSMYHNKAFLVDFDYDMKQNNSTDVAFGLSKNLKHIKEGTRFLFQGSLPFEKTDNGWRAKEFNNKNFNVVTSNYMTSQMVEEKQKLLVQKQNSFIKEGDWRKTDIEEITSLPIYSNVADVPIFKNSVTKFSIKKLKSRCINCRNDNMKALDDAFKKVINQTNRFTPSTKEKFDSNSNSTKMTLFISNITFKHLGVKENGDNKGFSCSIQYTISINGNYKTPELLEFKDTKSAKVISSTFKYYPNKEGAFKGALMKFEKKWHDFIIKYEPYTLTITRIETNKKGKVDKIYLKKPETFVNIKRGSFLIYKRGDLIIKNQKYFFKSSIGKCVFKGEFMNNEITCEVRGSKNKKVLTQIKDLTEEYMAKSSF